MSEVRNPSDVYATATLTGAEYGSPHRYANPTPTAPAPTNTDTLPPIDYQRKVSSIIVESTPLQEIPQEETVRYVEVPVYEERVKVIPVKEQRVQVRRVPVPKYVTQTRQVPVPHVVERPKPKIIEREKIVDVARPKMIYQDEVRYDFVDHEVPVIVAQTSKPQIRATSKTTEIEATDYQPEITHYDVHLARPVESSLECVGLMSNKHVLATMTAPQYNTLVRKLNEGLDCRLLYIEQEGQIEFAPDPEVSYALVPPGTQIIGWTPKTKSQTRPPPSAPTKSFSEPGADGDFSESFVPRETASSVTRGIYADQSVKPRTTSRQVQRESDAAFNGLPMTGSAPNYSPNDGDSKESSVSSSINRVADQIYSSKRRYARPCCGTAPSVSSDRNNYPPRDRVPLPSVTLGSGTKRSEHRGTEHTGSTSGHALLATVGSDHPSFSRQRRSCAC